MESKIQAKIKIKLKKAGWKVIKTIQLSENGHTDLFCFRNGQTVFIEVKDKGGKLKPLQEYRIKEMTELGFVAFWTDNENDSRIESLLLT